MKKAVIVLVIAAALGAAALLLGHESPSRFGNVEPEVEETQETPREPEELALSISPEKVEQGEPVLVRVHGLSATSSVKSLTFRGRELGTFEHEGRVSALIGLDLRMAPGLYPLKLTLDDGRSIESTLAVGERYIAKAPLGIPEKLGGNTPQAEQELINTLVEEGRIISAIPSSDEKLWEGRWRLPIDPPIFVTDTYGYSRETGSSNISHKGTDYRAAVGTPVYAMNSGLVRFTDFLRNYGHTVVVDHGLGVHTLYMHLSEISVEKGQMVEKGELLGKSGDTGYVTGPHLHLTVRIGGISIDPEVFMAILGE